MKGIVLAGGTGSRLWPVTKVVSKQLLPIYDKPMIYYPLSTLMLCGIRDILVITTEGDIANYEELLGDGHRFGINITYAIQKKPEGLAQAFIIGESFIGNENIAMILGDNIFHGIGLGNGLKSLFSENGARVFTYQVSNPSDYGILNLDISGQPISIEEKPKVTASNTAVTGLYFFDNQVTNIAKKVKPSARGELEITSIIDVYLKRGELKVTQLSRGSVWLDTGNPNALHDAASYVQVIEERTGLKIACLEEIAFKNGWLEKQDILKICEQNQSSPYYKYVRDMLDE